MRPTLLTNFEVHNVVSLATDAMLSSRQLNLEHSHLAKPKRYAR